MTPYYDHAGIRIYHADCREVIPDIPAGYVLITDPPYGLNLGEHQDAENHGISGHLGKNGYASYNDSDDNLNAIVVPAVSAALVNAIRGCVFCAGGKIRAFPEPACVGGVYMPAAIGRNSWGFQNLMFLLLYGARPDGNVGSQPTTLVCTACAEKNGHPCPKPLKVMQWVVKQATKKDDTVVDLFMGSGTTLRAAKDLNRRAIGIEIEERYCEIAAKRLSQEVMDFGDAST